MIRKAKEKDLPGINEVLKQADYDPMPPQLIRDLCLVGEIDGHIRGVIWASISKSKFIAYVDYLVVDPHHKGLGARLTRDMMAYLRRMKVEKVMSLVEDVENTKESLQIQKEFGMKVYPSLFHFCVGEVDQMGVPWER